MTSQHLLPRLHACFGNPVSPQAYVSIDARLEKKLSVLWGSMLPAERFAGFLHLSGQVVNETRFELLRIALLPPDHFYNPALQPLSDRFETSMQDHLGGYSPNPLPWQHGIREEIDDPTAYQQSILHILEQGPFHLMPTSRRQKDWVPSEHHLVPRSRRRCFKYPNGEFYCANQDKGFRLKGSNVMKLPSRVHAMYHEVFANMHPLEGLSLLVDSIEPCLSENALARLRRITQMQLHEFYLKKLLFPHERDIVLRRERAVQN